MINESFIKYCYDIERRIIDNFINRKIKENPDLIDEMEFFFYNEDEIPTGYVGRKHYEGGYFVYGKHNKKVKELIFEFKKEMDLFVFWGDNLNIDNAEFYVDFLKRFERNLYLTKYP